jgi:hypothetical protein
MPSVRGLRALSEGFGRGAQGEGQHKEAKQGRPRRARASPSQLPLKRRTSDPRSPLPTPPPPQFMKIDVEGFEREVLTGAQGLLERRNVWFIAAGAATRALLSAARGPRLSEWARVSKVSCGSRGRQGSVAPKTQQPTDPPKPLRGECGDRRGGRREGIPQARGAPWPEETIAPPLLQSPVGPLGFRV